MNEAVTREEYRYQDQIIRDIQREVISVSMKMDSFMDSLEKVSGRVEELSVKETLREGKLKGISGAWGLLAGIIALALSLRPVFTELFFSENNIKTGGQINLVETSENNG
jgi:hypothetical protein